MQFKVNEIFHSIQGEGSRAGRPCLFIRLTGCPLRCTYCDTAYAFYEGERMELDAILDQVRTRLGPPLAGPNAPFVELTGGEPLAHPHAPALLAALQGLGHLVALETAGAHDLAAVPAGVVKIVDRKTPGSGEERALAGVQPGPPGVRPGRAEVRADRDRGLRMGQGLVPGTGRDGAGGGAVQPRLGVPGPRLAGGADRRGRAAGAVPAAAAQAGVGADAERGV